MRIFATFVAGALVGFSPLAAAQEKAPVNRPPTGECLCILPGNPPAAAGPRFAAVEDAQGQVVLADSIGQSPSQSGNERPVGDRVVLLPDGRVVVIPGPACRVLKLECDDEDPVSP
jgi:hypothetical protein